MQLNTKRGNKMKTQKTGETIVVEKKERKTWIENFLKYKEYYFMLIPGILFFLIFCYGPMYGIIIAFYDYMPLKGISGSNFVGLKHFEALFTGPFFLPVLRNTLILSFYKMIFGFFAPIILCLFLNEVKHPKFKKFVQSTSYLPHFVSWVVLSGIVIEFLSPSRGPINMALSAMGQDSIFFLADPKWFRTVLVSSDIWKSIGWGSIIYLAAVTSIDPQLYEAADIDGAGRLQKIRFVTIPAIIPIIIVMFIMESGKILNDNFQQVYNFLNPSVYGVGDVISTFVYRMGIEKMQYSFTTAVGLFKNILSLVMVIMANYIAKRTSEHSLW